MSLSGNRAKLKWQLIENNLVEYHTLCQEIYFASQKLQPRRDFENKNVVEQMDIVKHYRNREKKYYSWFTSNK